MSPLTSDAEPGSVATPKLAVTLSVRRVGVGEMVDLERLDLGPHALGEVHRAVEVGAGQHHGQLLAAVAGGLVDLAGRLLEDPGHLAQHDVALLVAVGVVDRLEVVEVDHHQAELLPEALGALDLGLEDLVEPAAVEEAGELVGHRLALDRLVQADVLDRHRRLADEVLEELALAVAERPPGAAHRRACRGRAGRRRCAGPARARGRRRDRLRPALRTPAPRTPRRAGPRRSRPACPCARPAPPASPLVNENARPPSAPTPSTAVRTAISSRPSRSRLEAKDSPIRRIELRSRRRSSSSSSRRRLELRRHLVELVAQRGELVAAHGRDARREVAACDAPRRAQETLEHPVEPARDEDRAGEGEEQEAGEDARGQALRGRDLRRRVAARIEHRELEAAAVEAGRRVRRDAVAVGPRSSRRRCRECVPARRTPAWWR